MPNRELTHRTVRTRDFPDFWVPGGSRANRTLLPVSPTGFAMPPRTAGFGNRDRFELNGKIGLHRAAGLIVLRECHQWQHNLALSGSIPFATSAIFLGKFNLWGI